MYIYIYMCMCMCVYIHVHVNIAQTIQLHFRPIEDSFLECASLLASLLLLLVPRSWASARGAQGRQDREEGWEWGRGLREAGQGGGMGGGREGEAQRRKEEQERGGQSQGLLTRPSAPARPGPRHRWSPWLSCSVLGVAVLGIIDACQRQGRRLFHCQEEGQGVHEDGQHKSTTLQTEWYATA